MASIYIHVPFCQSRCVYCDFYSTTQGDEWKERYVTALLREIEGRKQEIPYARVHSIYIGGGTPSQLSPYQLECIFNSLARHYVLSPEVEITLEVNPDDLTPEYLSALRHTPVNRISMGVQSLDDKMLHFLRRRHTARQACDAVESSLRFGYSNISVDLIYGLPRQTIQMWRSDVNEVLRWNVSHLSAYSLSYEEGTALHRMYLNGEVQECDEELSLQMYRYLLDAASEAGMEHYEISNFARPGFQSRHNHGYWTGIPYLGFGPGAHSYDGNRTRRWNLTNLHAYVNSSPEVPYDCELLSDEECYNEFIMTRLRTHEGADLSSLSAVDRDYCLRQAASYLQSGKLTLHGEVLTLTLEGVFISNAIMSDLMR